MNYPDRSTVDLGVVDLGSKVLVECKLHFPINRIFLALRLCDLFEENLSFPAM